MHKYSWHSTWHFELSSNKCWCICPALQPCHQSTKSIVSCSSFGCQRWQGGDRKKATAVASRKKSPPKGEKRHHWNQTQSQLETLPPFCWFLSHKTVLQSSHQQQLGLASNDVSRVDSCWPFGFANHGMIQFKELTRIAHLWKRIIIFLTTHGEGLCESPSQGKWIALGKSQMSAEERALAITSWNWLTDEDREDEEDDV